MGLFDKIFKSQQEISKEEINEIPWHPLTRIEQLDQIEKESGKITIAIFKHSTRCGISRMVLNQFEKEYNYNPEEDVKLYFLDLISEREISNEISQRFDVQHESPQLLIIKDRKVVEHASHHSIKEEMLKKYANRG